MTFRIGHAVDVHAFAKSSTETDGLNDANGVSAGNASPADSSAVTSTGSSAVAGLDSASLTSSVPTQPGKPLMLACLEWPGEPALVGHSDGDAAAHATCDALLSAANLGDMGLVFGTDRPEWKGASGEAFLQEVCRMVADAGWVISNVSVQVIGNRPRMANRLKEAGQRMSEIVGAPVSVSATTTDHLGFLGRSEGLAATATALIEQTA